MIDKRLQITSIRNYYNSRITVVINDCVNVAYVLHRSRIYRPWSRWVLYAAYPEKSEYLFVSSFQLSDLDRIYQGDISFFIIPPVRLEYFENKV